MSDRVVVENNSLGPGHDEEELEKEHVDRLPKAYNIARSGVLFDEDGKPLPGTAGLGIGAVPIRGPYSNLKDSPTVGPGKNFTRAQKTNIYQQNMNSNGGVLRSDLDGQELVMPKKSQSGVTPPLNEAQIDHIVPGNLADSALGQGTNSYGNAQILSREQNRQKSNK